MPSYPPVRALGDSGHVNDHNIIRTDLVDLYTQIGTVAQNGVATYTLGATPQDLTAVTGSLNYLFTLTTSTRFVLPTLGDTHTATVEMTVIQDSTGDRTFGLMGSVAYPNGRPPAASSGANTGTYMRLRWCGTALGWVMLEWITGIEPPYVAAPSTYSSTTTYVTGKFWRNLRQREDLDHFMYIYVNFIPSAVRQWAQADGFTIDVASASDESPGASFGTGGWGYYDPTLKKIFYGNWQGDYNLTNYTGSAGSTTEDRNHFAVHEFGHYLDYRGFTQGMVATNTLLSNYAPVVAVYNAAVADGGVNHSQYGFTNAREWFAEMYGWYRVGNNTMMLGYCGTQGRVNTFTAQMATWSI